MAERSADATGDVDVVVIGSGFAGMCAALSAGPVIDVLTATATSLDVIDLATGQRVELRLAFISLTSTGLRIDREARVIDNSGRPVPGLYAAGECNGGVLGDVYVGSGNSMANCVVFGRTAGRNAGLLANQRVGAL